MQDQKIMLEMKNITKTYPGVKALDDVRFELRAGEVHALVGENGAGKSTLIKVLMGIEKKDKGEIIINGEPVDIKTPQDAAKNKIAAVFQELSQIPYLTVGENIFLGKEKDVSHGLLDRKSMYQKTDELLDKYDICELKSKDVINNISSAKRQLAEIMKAVAIKPRILILDEPTSSLTEGEAEKLFNIITAFKNEGIGIIYISHRMNELQRLADRVTVLRDGQFIDCQDMNDVSMDEIINMMVGRDVELYKKSRESRIDYKKAEKVLEVKNISKGHRFKDVSFDLYKGEVLGVAGLVGSGRSELMNLIFGIDQADSGEIIIEGKKVEIRNVRDALDNKIAMIPESRHLQGLVLIHNVEDNISLPLLKQFEKVKILSHKKKREFAQSMIDKYKVKTESTKKIVNYLSGGNQQKVVVAKWLATNPKILIVDELTAGIDVHSKAEIHKIISTLAQQGLSVIMISSEMPELLAHSDRIMVMNENRIIGIMEQADQEKIMSLIMEDKNICANTGLGGKA